MPNYPYDEIKTQIDRELIQTLNKNFDEVEQDVRKVTEPVQAILDGHYGEAALTAEFELRAQAKLEEIQPEFYEFQTDTTAQMAQNEIVISEDEPLQANIWYQDIGESPIQLGQGSGVSVQNADVADDLPAESSHKLWFDIE